MIVVITGTPGTGKSTVGKALAGRLGVKCYHLSDLVIKGKSLGYDQEKESLIADLEEIKKELWAVESAVIEGHYSHLLGIGDVVIVLRTHPKVLRRRLGRKNFSEKKITENLECEALDLCLIESLQRAENVLEIDTTGLIPEETVEIIMGIVEGRGDEFRPGKIDWSEEYFCGVSPRND